jgi:hypothetical protein
MRLVCVKLNEGMKDSRTNEHRRQRMQLSRVVYSLISAGFNVDAGKCGDARKSRRRMLLLRNELYEPESSEIRQWCKVMTKSVTSTTEATPSVLHSVISVVRECPTLLFFDA